MESNVSTNAPVKRERLASLDALRGFDIFLLFCLGIVRAFKNGPMADFTQHLDFWQGFAHQFEHVSWEGFTLCDLAMPLFIFTAGVSIPFSLSRYVGVNDKKQTLAIWFRLLRRVVVLWFFGMVVQGNLLKLDFAQIKLFSNTLQAIAVGYFFASLAFLYLNKCGRYILFIALLAGYWAANAFITIDGCGGGSYEKGMTLAYWIDCNVLGRFMDAAHVAEDGTVVFAEYYQYTWILSSLTFVATALTGVFAGDALYSLRQKDPNGENKSAKTAVFVKSLCAGLVCLGLGCAWDAVPQGSPFYCPIIKTIWTPSMVLFSSGWSYVALAFFYLFYDVLKFPFLKTFFVVFGANAFAAYIFSHVLHFDQIASWVTYGLEAKIGTWLGPLDQVLGMLIVWVILWDWRRLGRFFRA